MKITKRQLRRIIKEAIEGPDGVWYDDYGNRLQQDELPYRGGQPWQRDVPVGRGAEEYDYLDIDPTDEEMAAAGEYKDDDYPFVVRYSDSNTGEEIEKHINNEEESEDFFHMFFKTQPQGHPYSVD